MFTPWKVTSAINLFLPVLILAGLITSCAPTLLTPTDPSSSLVIGRIVIDNKHKGRFFGVLPLGTVDQGIEVEIESHDGNQYFKVTTEKQGYFFIPNIPPNTYQVRTARFQGTIGNETEGYSLRLRRLTFTPVPGKIVYVGTLFIELTEREKGKIREVREGENARAYYHQKYADSKWASREFITTEVVERIGGGEIIGQHYIHVRKGYKIALPSEEWYPRSARFLDVRFRKGEGSGWIAAGAFKKRPARPFADVNEWWLDRISTNRGWTDIEILEDRDLTLAGHNAKVVAFEFAYQSGCLAQ